MKIKIKQETLYSAKIQIKHENIERLNINTIMSILFCKINTAAIFILIITTITVIIFYPYINFHPYNNFTSSLNKSI